MTLEQWQRWPVWEKVVGPFVWILERQQERGEAGHHVDVRIATYNIHRCRGIDRRTSPARIAEVLRDIDADVIALQEVIGGGPAGAGQAEEIGAALGMGWVMTAVRQLRRHLFGNVILSRFPIAHHSHHDLSWRTGEARACQRADLDLGQGTLAARTTHLGTAYWNGVIRRRASLLMSTIIGWTQGDSR